MKATKRGVLTALAMSWAGVVAMGVAAAWLGAAENALLRAQTAKLYLIPSNAVPWSGNFYSIQRTNWPPLPCNSYPELDIYTFSDTPGHFWYDDRAVDYAALAKQWELEKALRALVEEEETGWPAGTPLGYSAGTLWLAIGQLTNGLAPLTIHGTVEEVLYEVQSRTALTNSGWVSEGAVLGATNQDWTATEVGVGDRTNTLFFRAQVWTDCDGYGTPPAWYVEHGLDPLSAGIASQDADADGLANRQEYLWGSDPQAAEGFGVWMGSPSGASGIP